MIMISSVGITLIALCVLESRGKLTLNRSILISVVALLAIYLGWPAIDGLLKTLMIR